MGRGRDENVKIRMGSRVGRYYIMPRSEEDSFGGREGNVLEDT